MLRTYAAPRKRGSVTSNFQVRIGGDSDSLLVNAAIASIHLNIRVYTLYSNGVAPYSTLSFDIEESLH